MAAEEGRRAWKDKAEADGFRPELIRILREHAWRRTNPKWKAVQDRLEELSEDGARANRLIRDGRQSAGQALLRRVQVEEAKAKLAPIEAEAELLERLDKLGIDREWTASDVEMTKLRLLFHFAGKAGRVATLDLTDEEL